MEHSIYQSKVIYNCLKQLNLCQVFSHTTIKHFLAILLSVFSLGYQGKTVNFEKYSSCHRTTIAHFLNKGTWNDAQLKDILKAAVIAVIYKEALDSGKPIFCTVDDTILSKTKPSSQALHPIEDAYFHQSHLKKKQDYGHQAVAVMLSCNGLVLNYAILMYDKSKSKIQLVCEVADELSVPPVISYFLCDSWYTTGKVMDAFLKKGFYTIGALKTNRVIYPCGIKQALNQFALLLCKHDTDVSLVTVNKRNYYVYRYEGKLNGIENAVVVLCYPEGAFLFPKALRAFISTNVSLTTQEILDYYVERWSIEVFFRQSKNKLALDKYQVRSTKGIQRYWLLMSLAHFICCTGTGNTVSFEDGYAFFQAETERERITYFYQCGANHIPLKDVLDFVG